MKELEVVGKNVDQAIKNGLLQLGKSREDVDIKILETGGLFKKAKVVLAYDDAENDIATLNQKILFAFVLGVHALGVVKEVIA